MAVIDHVILNVNDIPASEDFYVNVLGFTSEGQDGPFTVIRVSEDFTIQLAPWGTKGNEHLAFALPRKDFDDAFARMKERGIPFGDSFHSVGNNVGPGVEIGARGPGPTIYMNDPNNHLIEIRTYD
ncbi:MAG TPA: VOC family protein [Pyrinomonadaceae bacterium]|jgi:catechol 2,3-dioxygenase-like lactoylglutathione lyase family enzyme|nr:VOC family protein [Pyrinomonadaceae bacterium]